VHATRAGTPGFFWEQDVALLRRAMDVNYIGAVVLLKVRQDTRRRLMLRVG
jgi:hypothetical protein